MNYPYTLPTGYRINIRSDRARNSAMIAALAMFADRGYDATSMGDIADAAGISRRTLFRYFASKDDVIFADHEKLVATITQHLADALKRPNLNVQAALEQVGLLVFHHYTEQPHLSLQRYDVLQSVPSLRERELVMAARYQQCFTDFLRKALPATADRDILATALSAGLVAIHNYELRLWLREPSVSREKSLVRSLQYLTRRLLGSNDAA